MTAAASSPEAVAAFLAEVRQVLTEHGHGATAYLLIDQAVTRHGRPVAHTALDFLNTDAAVRALLKTR